MRIRKKHAKPPVQQRKISDVLKKIAHKKRIRVIISLSVLFLIVAYFVIGERGTYKLISFYNQKEKLAEDIQQLKIENKELEEFKEKLKIN